MIEPTVLMFEDAWDLMAFVNWAPAPNSISTCSPSHLVVHEVWAVIITPEQVPLVMGFKH